MNLEIQKINEWVPNDLLNANETEKRNIINFIKKYGWSKLSLHTYFKNMEIILLTNMQNTLNSIFYVDKFKEIDILNNYWNEIELQWKTIALLRDFHDHMCGRDKNHHIRTDDCNRFIHGIKKGINTHKFIKPVYRILNGCEKSFSFKHPLFKQFN
jgi:hypothetical protein